MGLLKVSLDVLKLDAKAYNNAARKVIAIEFRKAARAGLRAAIPRVPVQSGMARGSFLNVGKFLRVAVPISPTVKGQKYYPGGIPKTPQSGANLSTQADDFFKESKGRVEMEFSTDVFHFTLEDFIGVRSPSSPWKALETWQLVFDQEISNVVQRLPNIEEYILRSTIRIKGSSRTQTAFEPLERRRRIISDG